MANDEGWVLVDLNSPWVFLYFLVAAIAESIERWVKQWHHR